jgi:hypothetical protein
LDKEGGCVSLKAWYHFTSDTNNYGLGNLELTQIVAPTFLANGKLGAKCLNTGSFKWTAEQTASVFNNNEITIAFWIKVTGTTLGVMIGTESMQALNNRKFTIFQYPTANDLHWSWMNDAAKDTFCAGVLAGVFPTNVWTHCCITYKNPDFKVYINGTLLESRKAISNSTSFNYDTTILHNNADRCISDLRFYDHALSKKEVKLLSQGLVAHYQLKGMGSTNYLKGSGKYTKDTPLVRRASDKAEQMNDSYIYYDTSDLSVTIPSAGIYSFVFESDGNPSGHKTSGTTASERRLSMWLQNIETGTYYIWEKYAVGTSGELYGQRNLPAGSYRMRTNLYAADNIDYTIKLWNIKLVKGTYDPNDIWCPHVEDELYEALGLTSNTEPDCSGYNRMGTSAVMPERESASPRYSSCYKFVGNLNNKIYNTTTDFNFTDNFSWSCWVKHNYTGWKAGTNPPSASYAFTVGRADAGGYGYGLAETSATAMSIRFGSSNYPVNIDESWHHLAFTKTGTTICIYVDGVRTVKTFNGTLPTYSDGNGVGLGCFHFSSSLYPYYGSLSDFRIYATALSAEDILDLYKTYASVDSEYNFYTYELNETKQANFRKNGTANFQSFSDTAPVHDMKLTSLEDGSAWARIHWLDVSSTASWFSASEVAKCTNRSNRYSRMGIVDKFRDVDGKYEFMLRHPQLSSILYNRWTQTSSPNETTVTGFNKINPIGWNDHFGGIRKGTSGSSVYNCDTGTTWYAPIGQTAGWTNSSIPGANGGQLKEIELWVRIDNLPQEEKFKIYDTFISSKNFIEL